MAQVGSLVIDLIAETASFNANIQRASSNLNSEAAKMNRSLDSIARNIDTVVSAGKALIGAEIAGELIDLARRGLDYASSLGEVSQQLGTTTEDLQVYRYAATQVGIEQETMDKGLQKLARTLGEAQLGSKKASGVFSALGIDVRAANGEFATTSDVLPQIADALAKIPDPTRRAAVEVQLFGRAGQQLDTLLAGGSGSIDELRDAAQRLGLVLSDSQIQNADATADKLAEVKQVLEARVAGVVADNANAIYTLADSFISAANSGGKFLTMMDDVLRGADKVKSQQGYLSFLFTDVSEMRAIGATDRRMNTIMNTLPEGVNFSRNQPAGGADLDNMLAGASPKKKGGGKSGKSDAEKLTEEYEKQTAELTRQSQLDQVLAAGNKFGADLIESEARLREQLKGLDEDRLKKILDQNSALQQQRAITDDFKKQLGNVTDLAPAAIGKDAQDRINNDWHQIVKQSEESSKAVSSHWAETSQSILYSLDNLSNGIRGGDLLQTLSGVLDLFLGLGSVGLFGAKIQTNLKGAKGYASGGYTGAGGVNDIAGYVHGQEYVFDAAATKRIGLDNLERLRRGAGFRGGGYTGGGFSGASARMQPAERLIVEPSPYFNAVVDTRAQRVSAPMAGRAAAGGAALAQDQAAKRARRRIPGR